MAGARLYEDVTRQVTTGMGGPALINETLNWSEKPKDLTLTLGGGVTMKLVLIPAGEFMMGSNDGEAGEKPVHRVQITKPFYMGVTEVTKAQFGAFANAAGYRTEAETGDGAYGWTGTTWEKSKDFNWKNVGFTEGTDNPVECVSWNDAQAFCKWLSQKSGRTVRLPTEAESGNTPAVPARRPPSTPAKRSRPSRPTMKGTSRLPMERGVKVGERRRRWEVLRRIPGVFMTCTGTCGSGARTGTIRTPMGRARRQIRKGLRRGPVALCVAGPGATPCTPPDPRTATTTATRRTRSAGSGSVWW